MKRWALRIFAHDVGRKLLALLFAIVLFDVLDKKVQAEDKLTVKVEYVDAGLVDQVPDDPEASSKLVVAERGPGPKPLVVSSRPRPDRVTFRLKGTKDAIDLAKARRRTFVLRLQKEGALEPAAEDLQGVAALLDELGSGARIELEPVRWFVEVEESRPFTLDHDDLVLSGSPAPGYDRRLHTYVFRPEEVRIVGPHSAVESALAQRPTLFEPVQIERTSEVTQDVRLATRWKDVLRLQDATGEELLQGVRVTVKFARQMVNVPGVDGQFELPVQVICNDDALRRKDEQKSWRDGWRLDFPTAGAGGLKLAMQLLAPSTFVNAPVPDRAKLTIAKDNVELVVRAQDAGGVAERTTVAVSIIKLPDFPPDLDVVFADGSTRAEVEVIWIKPAGNGAAPGDKSGEKPGDRPGDRKEKGGGGGGNGDR